MPFTHDVLVLGHGLAGAAFVEECWRRGLHVAVFAQQRAGEASRVAAGVVNPVVLRRIVPSWRAHRMLRGSGPCYHDVEQREGRPILHPMAMAEVFANAQVVRQWLARERDTELDGLVRPGIRAGSPAPGILAEHGHGLVEQCAWLDVPLYLDLQAARLKHAGDLFSEAVTEEGIIPVQDGIRIRGCSAPWLVRCQGPYAQLPGLVLVKGETLTVRIPGLHLQGMVHRGVFILPLGDDRYRVGATFSWDHVWEGPTDEARSWLLERLRTLLVAPLRPTVEVLAHEAGVRPAAKDRRPILGRIAAHQAAFNGLGSRGALLAPWSAQHLAAHLFDSAPLDPEVDVARAF